MLERMEDALLVKPVDNVIGRFQLHDLLKEFAEEKLTEEPKQEEAAEYAHVTFLKALFTQYPFVGSAPGVAGKR